MSYAPPTFVDDPQSSPEMTKYLRIPMDAEEEFEIRESIARRKQSNFLSRIVGIGIIIAVAASLTGGIIFYTQHHKKHHSSSSDNAPTAAPTVDPLAVCFSDISCPAITSKQAKYDSNTGFTNYTGWYNGFGKEKCCNICSPNMLSPYGEEIVEESTWRPTSSLYSSTFKFNVSNFDYIIFDQMWIPQLCNALAAGHDPTLSHTSRSRCVPSVYSDADRFTRIGIHGIWPSMYTGAFLSCCTATSLSQAHLSTVDPVQMAQWDIYDTLQTQWFDPTALQYAAVPQSKTQSKTQTKTQTQSKTHTTTSSTSSAATTLRTALTYSNVSCGTCFLQNHEYQKHGTCFGTGVDAPYVYFATGLNLTNVLEPVTYQINNFADQIVTLEQLLALYPTNVNVLCDPQASHTTPNNVTVQVFFELRTCWTLTSEEEAFRVSYALGDADKHWGLVDCPAAGPSKFSNPCANGNIYIPLLNST